MTEGQVEWVEIIEPKTQRPMYGNLRTGELAWTPPQNATIKKRDNNQWWELYDPKTSRYYYYNEMLQQTVWHRPQNCDIIPLAKLQTLKLNTEARTDDPEAAKRQQQARHRHRHHHKHHHHHHHRHPSTDNLNSPVRDGAADLKNRRRGSEQLDRQPLQESVPAIQHGHSIQQIPAHVWSGGMQNSPHIQRAPLAQLDTQRVYPHHGHGRMRSESAPIDFIGVSLPDPKIRKLNDANQQAMMMRDNVFTHLTHENLTQSSISNLSEKSDHSQDFLTVERPDSRSSQSSHHSRDGFSTQPRKTSLDGHSGGSFQAALTQQLSMTNLPSAGNSLRSTGSGGRQVTSPKSKKKMPKMGITAMNRQRSQPAPPGVGPPGVPMGGYPQAGPVIVHSQSEERFHQFFPSPMASIPPQMMSHAANVNADQSDYQPWKLRQPEHPPLIQSASYHGRNNHQQRTTTPDSLSSQDSYSPALVPYAVTNINPDFRNNRPAVHKHSDSQLSQSSQISYNSQHSLSSQQSDSSARPMTSDSHSHVSQSSEDISFSNDLRVPNPILSMVTANVHAIAKADSESPERSSSSPIPLAKMRRHPHLPEDASAIYMNTDFIHQKQKERVHRDKLREMDKRDAEISGSPTLPIRFARGSRPDSGQTQTITNGSQDGDTLGELSDKEAGSDIELMLNRSFDTEGTEESSRETSTNVDTNSPMHTPGSPSSPGSHQGTVPSELFHQSLQRSRKSADSVSTGSGAIQMERSISVQENRPNSAKHGTIPASMKNSPSLNVITQAKKPSSSESDLENYAAENLNRHKRGLLRKKVSLTNMLSWTKEPIKKPMLITGDKALKKEAVESFKLIQAYMGDRVIKGQTRESIQLDLINRTWKHVPTRDEVFIQICRQTTENYVEDSLRAGWELMSICLNFFPPSVSFHTYLENYIKKHTSGEYDLRKVPVKDYADYCLKRLERSSKLGARKGAKGITMEEINLAKGTIFNPSMFGEMLEDVMALQKSRFPDRKLPWIVVVLTEEVLRLGAERTEGIFRVPGDIDEVNALKMKCDQWQPPECTDAHVPASLLKLWYRDLFQPLIPMQFYDRCIEVCEDPVGALEIVESLPELNRLVLCHLVRFLQVFAKEETFHITKMDVSNLSMVMAPNCLRCGSDNPQIIFENTRKEMAFLRALIQHQNTDFLEGVI